MSWSDLLEELVRAWDSDDYERFAAALQEARVFLSQVSTPPEAIAAIDPHVQDSGPRPTRAEHTSSSASSSSAVVDLDED